MIFIFCFYFVEIFGFNTEFLVGIPCLLRGSSTWAGKDNVPQGIVLIVNARPFIPVASMLHRT